MRQVGFSKFRKITSVIGLLSTTIAPPLHAQDTLDPIDQWDITKQETGDEAGVLLKVPQGQTERDWEVQAREERFKGIGLTMNAQDISERLVQRLGQACHDLTAETPEQHSIGDFEAVYVRLDCPKLRVGEEMLIIFSIAWVDVVDLQTKQVVFKRLPTDEEVRMAKAFLLRPAQPVEWTPDS